MLEIRLQPDLEGKFYVLIRDDSTGRSKRLGPLEEGPELETAIEAAIRELENPERSLESA